MLSIDELSKEMGVSKDTLRRWEREGKIKSTRTPGGHRRYEPAAAFTDKNKSDIKKHSVAYSRVSTYGQKQDLERQKQMLELYCSSKGYAFQSIEDIGSGMNYNKPGLKKLLELINSRKIDKIIVTHKDRLLRFGFELVNHLCEMNGISIEVINIDEEKSDDNKELVDDVLEIITVFSAKLYGKRSHKNKKVLEESKKMFIVD